MHGDFVHSTHNATETDPHGYGRRGIESHNNLWWRGTWWRTFRQLFRTPLLYTGFPRG